MGHEHVIINPCMYFSRNETRELVMWLSWGDDNQIMGILHVVKDKSENCQNKLN